MLEQEYEIASFLRTRCMNSLGKMILNGAVCIRGYKSLELSFHIIYGGASARTPASGHPCLHSVSPVHMHPAPTYPGPTPPDYVWGAHARAPSASHAHARGQQLQQVTTAGGYASIQKRGRGRQMPSRCQEEEEETMRQ